MIDPDLEQRIRKGNLSRRDFLRLSKNYGPPSLAAIYALLTNTACPPNNPPVNGYKNATLYILDFYQNSVTGGGVETDKGSYAITNGVSNIEYDSSIRCTINVPGYVKRETNIQNAKDYILVPSEWEAFFAHNNIGGMGTSKFVDTIKTYIDGSVSDPDYETVKQRLAISGEGRANNLVDNIDDANFIIHLNSDTNGHAENLSNGIIEKCNIFLKDSETGGFDPVHRPFYATVDEEIAQGLTHTEDCFLNPPEGNNSCIAGYTKGWKPIDKRIMDALYNRDYSTFSGAGYEREP